MHWDKCRQAVVDRGMEHLMSKDSEEVLRRTVADIAGEAVPADFDPLMAINNAMFGYVINHMGLIMLAERTEPDGMPENDGHVCPLCIIRKGYDNHNTPTGQCDDPNCPARVKTGDKPWDETQLASCADAMRRHAISIGVLKQTVH